MAHSRFESMHLKIGVVGCGAVGSYYGGRLCHFGQDVHFLLRSDYEAVRRNGVQVVSPQGDFRFRPRCARTPEEIGVCDWVIVALKSTANSEFRRLLPPLVGDHTAILTLQNGLGNEEAVAELFPADQVLGGLCFVCINRDRPGLIQHIAHGRITLGEYQRWPEPRTHDFATVLRNCGVPCEVSDNLARTHWEKLVWNIPFNGLGVASSAGWQALESGSVPADGSTTECLTTDRLLADPAWREWVVGLMREVIAAANALGLGVDPAWEHRHLAHTETMGPYRASTLLDYQNRLPLELNALFLEPLRRARQAGVAVPRMERLCSVLHRLAADRGLAGGIRGPVA